MAAERITVGSGQMTEGAVPDVAVTPEAAQGPASHLRLVGGTAVEGFVAQQPPAQAEPSTSRKHIPLHLQPRIGGSAAPRIWG